ncbi:MAG: ExbD/TolR family protein [bacterium]
MKVFRLEDADNFSPRITPLVDVVLLVLIFFLITATYKSVPHKLDVQVPEAALGDGQITTELRLFITAEGRFRLQDRWVSDDRLVAALRDIKEKQQHSPVLLISADSRARHQRLVDVVVAARQAGIEDFGFEITLGGSG